MADEEIKSGFTDQGKFSIDVRLIVACYICDETDTEVENFKDYVEKGRSLKILTEEYDQEIASPKGKRRFTTPDALKIVYWDPKRYYNEDVTPLIEARRDDNAILADMQRFVTGTPAVLLSDETFNTAFNSSINGYKNNNQWS